MADMHERLTDVLVEFVPGDREMAGRMAGAVVGVVADAWDEGYWAAGDDRDDETLTASETTNPYREGQG